MTRLNPHVEAVGEAYDAALACLDDLKRLRRASQAAGFTAPCPFAARRKDVSDFQQALKALQRDYVDLRKAAGAALTLLLLHEHELRVTPGRVILGQGCTFAIEAVAGCAAGVLKQVGGEAEADLSADRFQKLVTLYLNCEEGRRWNETEIQVAEAGLRSEVVGLLRVLNSTAGADSTLPTAKPDKGDANGENCGAQFVFAPDGDGYCIVGFGESGHFKNLKGFGIIARLVQTPSVPVAMLELVGAGGDQRIGADKRSRQEGLDPSALKEARDKLVELRQDYETAKAQNNTVEMDVTQRQIDKLESSLMQAMGLTGRSRDINSEADKLRPKILGTLKTAYGHLRKARPSMKELANHFEAAISSESGVFLVYRPTTPIEWQTSPPAKK